MASINATVSAVVSQSASIVHHDDKAFCSIYDASKAVGVSIPWLRLAEQQGKVSSYRTPGGHRRYSLAKLKSELYGMDYDQLADDARKVAVYSRCSSVSQKDAELTQRQDLLKNASERENVAEGEIAVYSEIASSFKERPQLMKLINDLVAGKLRVVYFAYKDRLSRTDSYHIVKSLAEQHNVKLVFLYTEPPKSDIEEMTQELVNFVTLIGNRQAAAKSAKVTTKHIPSTVLEYCFERLRAGVGTPQLCAELKSNGYTYEDGTEIKKSALWKKINRLRKAGYVENGLMRDKLAGKHTRIVRKS
jgi:putative resolvase